MAAFLVRGLRGPDRAATAGDEPVCASRSCELVKRTLEVLKNWAGREKESDRLGGDRAMGGVRLPVADVIHFPDLE